MIEQFEECSFEVDEHRYFNPAGVERPSVTQILSAQGIFDYSHVPKGVLEKARLRGHNLHRWTAEFDTYDWIEDGWISDDEQPYFEAWLRLRRELKPVIRAVEFRMMGHIANIEIAGTMDREIFIGRTKYILDLKFCASRHPGWRLQLALYEMLRTGRPRCGHLGRMSVQLFPDGRYSVQVYEDASDADAAIAAVVLTEWDGQASDYNADHARDTLQAWMSNHHLKPA